MNIVYLNRIPNPEYSIAAKVPNNTPFSDIFRSPAPLRKLGCVLVLSTSILTTQ